MNQVYPSQRTESGRAMESAVCVMS
jgi:hypothetical protein